MGRADRQHALSNAPIKKEYLVTTIYINGRIKKSDWIHQPIPYINGILDINDIIDKHNCATKNTYAAEIYVQERSKIKKSDKEHEKRGLLLWDINGTKSIDHVEYKRGTLDINAWNILSKIGRRK